MGTMLEDFNALKIKVAAAMARGDQAALNQKTHIVFVDEERRARKKPGHKTRFTFDLLSNQLYREVFAEWDRILSQIVNVTMARQIVGEYLRDCLRALTPEEIKRHLEQGEHKEVAAGPPRAQIPDWLK